MIPFAEVLADEKFVTSLIRQLDGNFNTNSLHLRLCFAKVFEAEQLSTH